jgi:hypothetical protein
MLSIKVILQLRWLAFTAEIWDDNIKMDLTEIGAKVWPERMWLSKETNGGCCEHGYEPSRLAE